MVIRKKKKIIKKKISKIRKKPRIEKLCFEDLLLFKCNAKVNVTRSTQKEDEVYIMVRMDNGGYVSICTKKSEIMNRNACIISEEIKHNLRSLL